MIVEAMSYLEAYNQIESDLPKVHIWADKYLPKVTKDFGAFIQSQEDIWKEYLNMDAINRYHEDGGERGDGGNKHPMEFNFEEIGGTYILINADMADMRE